MLAQRSIGRSGANSSVLSGAMIRAGPCFKTEGKRERSLGRHRPVQESCPRVPRSAHRSHSIGFPPRSMLTKSLPFRRCFGGKMRALRRLAIPALPRRVFMASALPVRGFAAAGESSKRTRRGAAGFSPSDVASRAQLLPPSRRRAIGLRVTRWARSQYQTRCTGARRRSE